MLIVSGVRERVELVPVVDGVSPEEVLGEEFESAEFGFASVDEEPALSVDLVVDALDELAEEDAVAKLLEGVFGAEFESVACLLKKTTEDFGIDFGEVLNGSEGLGVEENLAPVVRDALVVADFFPEVLQEESDNLLPLNEVVELVAEHGSE